MLPSNVRVVPNVPEAVTHDLTLAIRQSDSARGRTVLCLSGGGTPLPVYRALAQQPDMPWGRTWIAWGDERLVPPDHPDRNERAAREALLDRVPIPEDQVLPWPYAPEADPNALAEAYELRLRRALGDPQRTPWFDVTLLGLGEDAHTAGLFPGTGGTRASGLAVATRPSSQPTPRLTLTPAALSSSRRVWFLVSGDAKRDALADTLAHASSREPEVAERLPATRITALEELRVYTDVAPP